MLQGLDAGPIIAGAYTSGDGICPMLAAHRAGGRCSAAFFADAWDRFVFRDGRGHRNAARRASERELRILRVHLQASLLDDELDQATLAGALSAHRTPLGRGEREREDQPAAAERGRPGDRDRAGELRGRPGWAWSRLFRRYDDYERALARLHAASDPDRAAAPEPAAVPPRSG